MIHHKLMVHMWIVGLLIMSSGFAVQSPTSPLSDSNWRRYCWEEQPSTLLRLSGSLQALYVRYNLKHPAAPLYPCIKILLDDNCETKTLTFCPLTAQYELSAATKLVLICLPTGDPDYDVRLLMERTMPFMTPITTIYYSRQNSLYITEEDEPDFTTAQAMDES